MPEKSKKDAENPVDEEKIEIVDVGGRRRSPSGPPPPGRRRSFQPGSSNHKNRNVGP